MRRNIEDLNMDIILKQIENKLMNYMMLDWFKIKELDKVQLRKLN